MSTSANHSCPLCEAYRRGLQDGTRDVVARVYARAMDLGAHPSVSVRDLGRAYADVAGFIESIDREPKEKT